MKPAYVAAAAVAALAFAGTAGAAEVEIRNAVARVVVIPEDRADIAVEIEHGSSQLERLEVTRRGSNVFIDGNLDRNAVRNCTAAREGSTQPGEGARVEVRGVGEIDVSDAPLVVVRTPLDVDVTAGGGGRTGLLSWGGSNGAVYGAVGRGARSIELSNRGCGDWTIANTQGQLDLSNAGSGSMRAGTSGSLDLAVAGSGNVAVGATGVADVAIAGSGDVRLAAARSADVSIAGSGDVVIARLDGDTLDVSIAGSGDVRVDGGQVQTADVSIAGSGGVTFDGRVGDVSVSIMGSGDVRIAEATGSVSRSIMGSGDVRIGQ